MDGSLLTTTPALALASGNFNQVPVIAGTNHDEYRLFVALQYDFGVGPLMNADYATAVSALWGTGSSPPPFCPLDEALEIFKRITDSAADHDVIRRQLLRTVAP